MAEKRLFDEIFGQNQSPIKLFVRPAGAYKRVTLSPLPAFIAAASLAHACLLPDRTASSEANDASRAGHAEQALVEPAALSKNSPAQPSAKSTSKAQDKPTTNPIPVVPDLAHAPKQRPPSPGVWSYVLPVDYGIRQDDAGSGRFRAPRSHGAHNGVDLLAPIGTPVIAPCAGLIRGGKSPSFGIWAQVVCPVPRQLVRQGNLHASIFFAHLDSRTFSATDWVPVRRDRRIGRVGKTGNARSSRVSPHLHLEVIIHSSREKAKAELHRGYDQSSVPQAEAFFSALKERCLLPYGLTPDKFGMRRARRVDPFLVFTCLSSSRPAYPSKRSKLVERSEPWSRHYYAKAFDVDEGPGDFLLVR